MSGGDHNQGEGRHVCEPPSEGLPGDEWTCPVCGLRYFANEPDYSDVDGAFIEWEVSS